MKDEKKVTTPEKKSATLTDEQQKNVAGGDGYTKICPHCGQEINIVLYMKHLEDCQTLPFSNQGDFTSELKPDIVNFDNPKP